MSDSGALTRAIAQLVAVVRRDLAHPRSVLLPTWNTAPRLLASAAVSHALLLLQRIDDERLQGDDLVLRLLARAHYETWITGMYLVLRPEEAHQRLLEAQRDSLERQHAQIARDNETIRQRREKAAARKTRLEQQRADAIDAGHGAAADDIPIVELPRDYELDFDLRPVLAQWSDIDAKKLTIEDIDKAVNRAARAEGHAWAHNYALVYRALSYLGAHPTYWVLSHYIEVPGIFAHVRERARVAPLAVASTHSALLLSAFLAGEVIGAAGGDAGPYEDIAAEWIPEGTSPPFGSRTDPMRPRGDI